MRPLLALLLFLNFLSSAAWAQTSPSPASPTPTPANPSAPANSSSSDLDHLTQSNRELLDLLKKQQAVLEDIQLDRRLQSRQIGLLEERFAAALQENAKLQAKVARLEATLAAGPAAAPQPGATNTSPAEPPKTAVTTPTPTPAPPATYLPPPPPESETVAGTKSWHRLFAISGNDAKKTDLFHITGPQWRVIWHNQDKPGDVYKNTSALFINAFPKDDTIPQKICSQLGSGGDTTELTGHGNYYLKVEASGGSWELAVEDFR